MEKFEPKVGDVYYMADVNSDKLYHARKWYGDPWDLNQESRGVAFNTHEEAIAKSKEMLGIYTIDGVEYTRGEKVTIEEVGHGGSNC